jgi:anti-sigma factor RsiW
MATSDELSDVDPVDEELIAYLDDELPVSDRARIERKLADDDAFRERLRRLQQAWDALDLLPRPSADHAFTTSTMQLVATSQANLVHEEEREVTRRRWLVRLATMAAAVIALAAGFALVHRRLTTEDRALVRDLPVIEHVDQLHNTPSLEFLEALEREGLFQGESHDS